MEGMEYEPLYALRRQAGRRSSTKKPIYVACDAYVTLTDGTGVVHQRAGIR